MAGFSGGNTNAIIPALETSFMYKKLTLYSENEYAINLDDKTSHYFFSWSELTYNVTNWLQPCIVAQRTRLYKSGRYIDRGFMAAAEFLPRPSLSAYLFDPFDKDRVFFVLGLNVNF